MVLGGQNAEASGAMQTRILGKTGARVSIVAFGCGSRFLAYGNEDAAVNVLNHALDSGISYLDTAYGYGDGQSETWIGQVAKTRRKEFFLATKIEPRDGDAAMRILEGTLKRLQTDQVDLIHVHGLQGARRPGKGRSQEWCDERALQTARSKSHALHRHHQSLQSDGIEGRD